MAATQGFTSRGHPERSGRGPPGCACRGCKGVRRTVRGR